MVRVINRGDVPAPKKAKGSGQVAHDAPGEVVFDDGALAFVDDWVDVADGQAHESHLKDGSSGGKQSRQNQRLGVGAAPKKVEPKVRRHDGYLITSDSSTPSRLPPHT